MHICASDARPSIAAGLDSVILLPGERLYGYQSPGGGAALFGVIVGVREWKVGRR